MAEDLHRQSPVCFRPATEDDGAWLTKHAQRTGRSVYKVMADILAEYRQRHEGASPSGPPTPPGPSS